ncbi:hypothetical protein GQ457_12G029400 [Hibiscus cannabinus]
MASREVSTMIKQGFISDPTLSLPFSPSRTTLPRLSSPSSSPPPPPPPPAESTRPSHNNPTLFEMMSEENLRGSKTMEESRRRTQRRVAKFLTELNAYSLKNGGLGPSDVRLTVVSRDGQRVPMDVHGRVLSEKSRFFADNLSQRREKGVSHTVEISECDDVEVYVETVVLMYCDDLKKRLIGESVTKVLALLQVSAAIMFDAGITSCLEYLEAVPWSEDEEEKVVSHLSQLELPGLTTPQVLQRVSSEPSTSARSDGILLNLLSGVLQAKDDKARQEMKTLISRLLRADSLDDDSLFDVSKDTLYHLCHRCLGSLFLCLSEAIGMEDGKQDRGVLMAEIAREADNLQWIVDILIEKGMANDFVKLWADQRELAELHSKIPTVYRHGISRITAQLCIAMGRGNILVPNESRFSLVSTWLDALYEDFGWMRRAYKSVDKKLVEDGLSKTILTLSLGQQQVVLLNWFDRFLNKGDDCPNIQRAFEVWWRRAFVRQYTHVDDTSQLQITVSSYST